MTLDYAEIGKRILHPKRRAILEYIDAASEPVSPKELSRAFPWGLGVISYHVSVLRDRGLIKLAGTRKRRGATEHFYRVHPDVRLGGSK